MRHPTVLIGSAAVVEQGPGLLGRTPKDRDYLTVAPRETLPPGDYVDGRGILDVYEFSGEVASLDEVYTLKVSHSPWGDDPRVWRKHLRDIALLKEGGARLIPELHAAAYAQWELRKGPKHVDLKQDLRAFFSPTVRRTYTHDSLHRCVAYHEGSPLFERILAPGHAVFPSHARFQALSEKEKELLVREEVMVLALERSLIPRAQRGETPSMSMLFSAYGEWLHALTTRMSKGWFPQWIIENFPAVEAPTFDYWRKFQDSSHKEPFRPEA